jgi:coiled-coil domain-containing protein 25
MVFYFTSTVCDPPVTLYMGRDKFENEEMLQHGIQEDIWFHVDSLSSAHVYLKLQPAWTLDTIPQEVVEECAQLVKYNSIEGRVCFLFIDRKQKE